MVGAILRWSYSTEPPILICVIAIKTGSSSLPDAIELIC